MFKKIDAADLIWLREFEGLSRRDLFAACALKGLLASGASLFQLDGESVPAARLAVLFGDTLLKELESKYES